MVGEEERLPPAVWHPRSECARDQKAQAQVDVQGVQVHIEGMRDRGERPRRDEPGEKRPVGDGDVHLTVSFMRRAENSAVGLALGVIDHPLAQRHLEEDPQDHRHEESARELCGDELPTQKD